jgi:hypothetical protein
MAAGMKAAGSTSGSEPFGRRAAALEVNGRRVNEAIERGERGDGHAVFVCECGYLGCNETVELSTSDYEAVRSDFDRFLIVPGHEIDDVDQVVERYRDYFVVIKRQPEAREMASASDERSH